MRADEVYAILKGKLVELTEDIKSMGDWKPIQHKGTVQTADDLPTDAKEGWMYNIATDSIYGAAGMNVVMTSEGWDPMGPIINMGPYLTKEEGNKTFQPKGNYLSGTDSDLKESGKAADAKVTGEKIAKNSSDITKKLDKNQGVENSGKIAGINESGDIVPIFPVGVEYNSETNCLEFGSDQKMELNQGIGLDSTLTKTGSAADAGATGKEINSLKEDISNKITKFYASSKGETHLADSDDGKIMDMMLYGKSEQKQYSGKNLLNYDAWKDTPITRGTAIYENNGITLTATGRDCYSEMGEKFPDNAKIKVSEGETLTFSWEESENKEGYIYIFGNGIATNGVSTDNRTSKKLSYTVPSGVTFITFRFGVVTTGDTISYKNIQIEKGSALTAYEPYTGGIPSPSPDYPQEIKSVVNPTVKVSNEDGTQFKTVTLPYTLNAIPVSSGGNVTIDGQQYIADYVDVEREKLVRMVDDVEAKNYTWDLYPGGNNMPRRFGMNDTIRFNMPADIRIMSSHFKQIAANTRTDLSTWFQTYYIAITDMNEKWKNSEALIQWFSENNVHFYLPLKTPTEIDLTPEEIAAFKTLVTYYPTTNISVNSEQLDGYTVFNYPISMANGWNYVKKQLNDNRDYIYDMDIQSAEAYVNSEYAVALTELEV